MKLIRLFFAVFLNAYSFSADPNFFGSRKRRKEKEALADEFKSRAQDISGEIEQIRAENPFETAAAKSAMTRASRGAKMMQERMLNTLGASGGTAEALVGAQGQLGEQIGSTAGQIATGAEALKQQEISNLRGLQAGYEGQYAGISQAASNERGSGWKDFMTFSDQAIGAAKEAMKFI